MASLLKDIYFDTKHQASFESKANLQKISKLSRGEIDKFTKGTSVYSLHKPIRKKIKRNRMIVHGIDSIWSLDTANMTNIQSYNDGINHLLIAIDNFSKYLFVKPLKDLKGETVTAAFSSIMLESKRIPATLHTDAGTEFVNYNFKELLDSLNISHYTLGTAQKAFVAERVILTLKRKLYKYFTYTRTYKYIDVLQDFVSKYNKSVHRSIKMSPNKVNFKNESLVFKNLYSDIRPRKEAKYKLNQDVRVSLDKPFAHKGYTEGWSREIYKIAHIFGNRTNSPMYRLKSLNDELIKGSFYQEELQPVTYDENELFEIDKILAKKGKGSNLKYLVSFKGWDKSFNTWISHKQVETVTHGQ